MLSRNFIIRAVVISATVLGTLTFFGKMVSNHQAVIESGKPLLLRLRPVDPRALMQGDYMVLAYDRDLYPKMDETAPKTGYAVFSVDDNHVGTFEHSQQTPNTSDKQRALRFVRTRNGYAVYGGSRYYFQEGNAELYEDAEFGVFKVSANGEAILVGLAGEDFQTIKPD